MLRDNLDTLAQDICRSDMQSTEALLERMDFARASAKSQDRPDPILKMKRGLVKYMGAAYYLRDAARFHAAVAAYQGTTDELLASFDVPAAALLVDLCLAIIGGPANLRRATIAAIMRGAREPETPDAFRAAARILAATSDLDPDSAMSDAWALLGACRRQELPDERIGRFLPFAVAAIRVNRGDFTRSGKAVGRALHRVDRAVEASVQAELERIRRGGASAVTASSFVDFPTAALTAIAASRAARSVQDAWPTTLFSDFRWMGHSGWA